MGRITSAGMGNSRQQDAYHNQFLDTASMLAAGLKTTFASGMPRRTAEEGQDASSDPVAVTFERPQQENLIAPNSVLQEHVVSSIENLKGDLIAMFQEMCSNAVLASRMEGMIRRIEDIQQSMGIEFNLFDPLSNMSGLKSGEALENADKVISNTLKHYRLYGVSSITSTVGQFGPTILLSLFGEDKDVGFEVDAFIAAKSDFNGNEAIDYVWSPDGGRMTVKARTNGAWRDMSQDFVIDCKVKRYTLGAADPKLASLFLGEKIITEGKEKIVEALKVNTDDLKFGKCRAFSAKPSIIVKLRELVQVNRD